MKGARAIVLALAFAVSCGGGSDAVTSAPNNRAGTYALTALNGSPLPYYDQTTTSALTGGQCVIRSDATFTATFTFVGGLANGTQQVTGLFTPIDAQSADIALSSGTHSTAQLTPTGFTALLGVWNVTFTKQ